MWCRGAIRSVLAIVIIFIILTPGTASVLGSLDPREGFDLLRAIIPQCGAAARRIPKNPKRPTVQRLSAFPKGQQHSIAGSRCVRCGVGGASDRVSEDPLQWDTFNLFIPLWFFLTTKQTSQRLHLVTSCMLGMSPVSRGSQPPEILAECRVCDRRSLPKGICASQTHRTVLNQGV